MSVRADHELLIDLEDDGDGAQGFGHAANAGGFLPDDTVAQAEADKLVSRHPHVFGDVAIKLL